MRILIAIFLLSMVFAQCTQVGNNQTGRDRKTPRGTVVQPAGGGYTPVGFNDYWYDGKAEISSYQLSQSRYGELHEGEAVLIFVTEDFSRSRQVKLDNPEQAGPDRLPVLKLNSTRKFQTGVYPYSILNSVFSPVDIVKDPLPVKISTSVQEWCGHVFSQMNLKGTEYDAKWFSYFETEGDHIGISLPKVMPEDGLWNLIRINPARLPVGKQKLIPGSVSARLTHKPMSAQDAELTLTPAGADSTLQCYIINYPGANRTLKIYFEKAPPFAITGWEETYPEFGNTLTSKAVRKKTIKLDYWNRHNNADLPLLEDLQ